MKHTNFLTTPPEQQVYQEVAQSEKPKSAQKEKGRE